MTSRATTSAAPSSEKMPPIDHSMPRVVSALERFSVPSARTINGLPQLGQRLASGGVAAPQ